MDSRRKVITVAYSEKKSDRFLCFRRVMDLKPCVPRQSFPQPIRVKASRRKDLGTVVGLDVKTHRSSLKRNGFVKVMPLSGT